MQTYLCKECGVRFSSGRRKKNTAIKRLWKEYVFGKQTMRELNLDKRTILKLFATYRAPKKHHRPRPIHLVTDATYFGERTEKTSWCVAVVRDPRAKEDLVWQFGERETTSLYVNLKEQLTDLGYTVLSVTGDGFAGIRSAFSGIPFQMCHVHMKRIVVDGTTMKPQTEAGIVLLALVKTLPTADSTTFNRRLDGYVEKYRDFLNEKTTNPLTGETFWTHKELRSAVLSLIHFRRYLFTFEMNKKIPKTTNSLEGRFSHINEIVAIHRGLSRPQKQKVLNTLFLASTIAPSKKKLMYVL